MYGYDEERDYPGWPIVSDGCRNVPEAMLKQDQIWVDSRHRVHPITGLETDHLLNIIAWIKDHASHGSWKMPALLSPLMRGLEAEQKRREKAKPKQLTPRQAIKSVVTEDIANRGKLSPDQFATKMMTGLHIRGFHIVKKS